MPQKTRGFYTGTRSENPFSRGYQDYMDEQKLNSEIENRDFDNKIAAERLNMDKQKSQSDIKRNELTQDEHDMVLRAMTGGIGEDDLKSILSSSTTGYSDTRPGVQKAISKFSQGVTPSVMMAIAKQKSSPDKPSAGDESRKARREQAILNAVNYFENMNPGDEIAKGTPATKQTLGRLLSTNFKDADPNDPRIQESLRRFENIPQKPSMFDKLKSIASGVGYGSAKLLKNMIPGTESSAPEQNQENKPAVEPSLPPTQGVKEGAVLRSKSMGRATHVLRGGQWQPIR